MIRILMIALEFPPVQTTGSFRSLNFAKQFPALGVSPTVISIESDLGSQIFGAPKNDHLLEDLPEEVKVLRIKSDEIIKKEGKVKTYLRLLTRFNDTFDGRFKQSLKALQFGELANQHFDAVYVSAPPFGAARLGERLAKHFGIPMILDMRDAWSAWVAQPRTTYLHHMATLRAEKQAFTRADRVVTVTQQLADLFRSTHPELPAQKFCVVHNGFTGPDIKEPQVTRRSGKRTFDIGYVGSFYYEPKIQKGIRSPTRWIQYDPLMEDWSYRSPLYFFKALRALKNTNPSLLNRIRFHHLGVEPAWLPAMVAKYNLGENYVAHGRQPKEAVKNFLSDMDAVLATSMKREDGGDYCLASKTFDYVKARKPVFAFVTEGAQRDFLMKSGVSTIFDPDDEKQSAIQIDNFINRFTEQEINLDFINQFSTRATAQKMASEIQRAIDEFS